MGIRVSYIGEDGKRKSFLKDGKTSVHARNMRANPFRSIEDAVKPGPGGVNGRMDIIERDGSVGIFNGKLILKGDKNITPKARASVNGSFYTKRGGWQGWCVLDDIDPKIVGVHLGGPGNCSDMPISTEVKAESNTAFSEEYLTRIVERIGDKDDGEEFEGKRVLVAFFRRRDTTAGGRAFAVSPERSVIVAVFDDALPGEYEEVEVLTALKTELVEDPETHMKKRVVKYKKRKILVPKSDNEESDWIEAGSTMPEMHDETLVEHVAYDEDEHKFTQTKRKVKVLGDVSGEQIGPTDVFVAVPHIACDGDTSGGGEAFGGGR